mmetsp:Transcript_6078/g.14877  ORF Transcript_6078/g.14877 Transcript_6078/m.14877 type:complete len:114 (+) Transcript_6078:2525-2866(+)
METLMRSSFFFIGLALWVSCFSPAKGRNERFSPFGEDGVHHPKQSNYIRLNVFVLLASGTKKQKGSRNRRLWWIPTTCRLLFPKHESGTLRSFSRAYSKVVKEKKRKKEKERK